MGPSHEHSTAFGGLATAIGRGMGLPEQRVAQLRLAAILHDVGKVAVPDAILRKPTPLSEEEVAIVRTHPSVGADMVSRIEGLETIATWIRHSNEHLDGTGFPRGLRSREIPLESRILLVADAFDAMTSNLAYSAAVSAVEALAELRR